MKYVPLDRRKVSVIIVAALVGTAMVAFWGAFEAMWRYHWFPAWDSTKLGLYDRLFQGDSYYSHAPLVPVVSLVLGWIIVRRVRIAFRPAPILGIAVLACSLGLQVLSCVVDVQFTQGFAFVGVVAGVVLVLWGTNALRRLWFPVALLLLMMPLPPIVISGLSFRLKMIAADWGVALASLVGVPVERMGSRLLLSEGREMVVGSVCAGLRTLISLVGFGAVYIYACRLRGLWRVGLFAATIPVARASNCLRIVSLIIVGHVWGVAVATGWYHEFSGPLVFLFAFFFMFGLEEAVVRLRHAMGRPAGAVGVLPELRRPAGEGVSAGELIRPAASVGGVIAAAMMLLAAWGVHGIARTGGIPGSGGGLVLEEVPSALQVGQSRFVGQDKELDPVTLRILRNCPYLNRIYTSGSSPQVALCITYNRGNRRSTHPPDVCLEGGGSTIIARGEVGAQNGPDGETVPCREVVVQRGGELEYHLYTYRCGAGYTSNWYLQQCMIIWNSLIHRSVTGGLIRLSTPVNGRDVNDARRRLMEFMQLISPHLDRAML